MALLLGWLARREWIWFLFIVPTIGAGATAYTMARQDRRTAHAVNESGGVRPAAPSMER